MKYCVISFLVGASILISYCFRYSIADSEEEELIEYINIAIQKQVNAILNENFLWLLGNFTTAFRRGTAYYLSFDMIKSLCLTFGNADKMLDGTYGIRHCSEFNPRQKKQCVYIVYTNAKSTKRLKLHGACA
ncbi:putative ARF guanine-nucleotide exchange factor 2 [Trichinella spiralis]|nr:putative ARF guanine-nucleotide exchange factor 2 [Trichinella spiralis]